MPQGLEDTLEDGSGNRVTALGFNYKGSYLAAGHHDGRTTVWDFDTRSIVRVLIGHVRPVTSISWTKNVRYLATGSLDWSVKVWDVTTSDIHYSHVFNSMVFRAIFHPTQPLLLVSLWMDNPHLINIETKEVRVLKEDRQEGLGDTSIQFTAYWNVSGDLIYIGGSDGSVNIIKLETGETTHSFVAMDDQVKVGIKSIAFSPDGLQYVLNCMDRTMRLYNVADQLPAMRLAGGVDVVQWKTCFFYGDDYIISASSESASQRIYIWHRHFGQLNSTLEGLRDTVLELTAHPIRPIFVTSSTSGLLYVWGKKATESWSAYAPGFTELEENEEYVEREDEFDEFPEEPPVKPNTEVSEEIELDLSEGEEMEYFFSVRPVVEAELVSATQPGLEAVKGNRKTILDEI